MRRQTPGSTRGSWWRRLPGGLAAAVALAAAPGPGDAVQAAGAVQAGAAVRTGAAVPAGNAAQAADAVLLRDALVVDGSGDAPFPGEVLVAGGRIESVGGPGELQAPAGARVVELGGRALAPGFIDIHNHSAGGVLDDPGAAALVSQGVTLVVVGADGSSPWPIDEYLARVDATSPAVDVAALVGHGTIRRRVLGDDVGRASTDAEIAAMAALVEEGMEAGAFGLSSGLEYDTALHAETEELIALARVAARHGGFYMTHMRDEELHVMEAIDEAIRIGVEGGLPVQISHIKMGDATAWGRSEEALGRLRAARSAGLDITADWYPYGASATSLALVVPSRRFDDPEAVAAGLEVRGGADRIQISRYRPDPSVEGMRLDEIAAAREMTPVEMYMQMMDRGGAGMISHSMDPGDVDRFAVDPLVMVASDGGIGSSHPRGAGTFPRVLGHYVRERGLLTLQGAVHKMTAMPARRLGLGDRGRIEAGAVADLVAFDPATVVDRATFEEPELLSEGITEVWVAGTLVWSDGETTGEHPGRALRHR